MLWKVIRPLGVNWGNVTGGEADYIVWSCMICTAHQNHLGDQINTNELVWQVWGRGEMHIGVWGVGVGGDLDVDGKILLNLTFKKWDGVAWTGLMCLGLGADGRLL